MAAEGRQLTGTVFVPTPAGRPSYSWGEAAASGSEMGGVERGYALARSWYGANAFFCSAVGGVRASGARERLCATRETMGEHVINGRRGDTLLVMGGEDGFSCRRRGGVWCIIAGRAAIGCLLASG